MKKQKFMKLTAFASAPSLENSFSSPETHSAEISVVFSGKNVKIHGWDGSAWSVIYTWNSVDKQYTFNNTFDNYFLESMTGGDETMGVSFFSINDYQGSTPTLAGVNREVRLYDVDEVPIYTPSDAGKMLTIMSDGSLRWLGASVTWMIDGSPVPNAPSASYVEDRADLTLEGTAALNNSVLSFDGAGYATIPDGFRYTDNLTVSVWFKTTATGDRRIISSHIRSAGYNGFFIMLSNGQLWYRHPDQAGIWTYGPSGLNDGEWHHFAMTYEAGGQWAGYLDGVQIDSGAAGAATGYLAEWPCYIGANGWNGNNPYGHFIGEINDIKIENVTRSSSEIISDYNSGLNPTGYVEDRLDLTLGAGTTIVGSVANIGSDYSASLQVGGAGSAGPFRSLLETYAYSISFFVKTVKTSDMVLVADHWRGTSNGFFVQYGADGVFAFIKGNGSGAVYSSTSTQVLRDGSWHHVTLTVNPDTTHKIYIDGYEFCSVSVGGNAPFHASSTLSFGWLEKGPHAQDDGRTVDGQMNQIKIHDSTLSAAEVLANYNSELTPTEYIEDRNDLILGAGTTIVDSVVHVGNDATSSLQVGGVGSAGPFRSLFETYEFSVSFFMKTTNTGNAMLVTDCWAGTFNGWFVYLSSTGHLKFVNGAGGGELSSPTTANQLRDGNWHHVAITVAPDSTNKVYIDGVEFCSINLGGNRPFHASSALTFGWISNGQVAPFGGYPLDGQMNQIQIHDSTLSAAEVLSIYSSGFQSETTVLDENGQTFVRANRDVLNLGDDPSYDRVEGEDFAVEGEFRLASLWGSGIFDVLGKGQNAGWMGWAVILYGGYIRMFAHSAGSATSAHGMNASFSPVVGQWYHFKAIWKADGKQEMWVDGVKLAERTVTGAGYFPPIDSTYDMKIGEVFTNEVRNFDGDIRNVKIQSGVIN